MANVTALLVLVFALPMFDEGGKIKWSRKPPEEVLAAAAKDKKPVLVYFRADWAAHCTQLDSGAFSEEAIVRQSECYERVLVDCTDRAVLEKMRGKYGIEVVPTVQIYGADGKLAEQFNGYRTSDVVLRIFAAFAPPDRTAEQKTADKNDAEWRDTHRVHLRNGNFLDGRILEEGSETEIVLVFSKGVSIKIKRMDIVEIELLRMRRLDEDRKVVRPTPTPPVRTPQPTVRPSPQPTADPGPNPTPSPRPKEIVEDEKEPAVPEFVKRGIADGIARLNQIEEEARKPGGRFQEGEHSAIVLELRQTGEAGLKYIIWLLKSPRWEERRDAVRALGHIKNMAAQPAVLRFLNPKEEWPVQEETCFALGRLADPSSIEPLIKMIDSKFHPVKEAAIMGLRMITNVHDVAGNRDAWTTWWKLNKHKFGIK